MSISLPEAFGRLLRAEMRGRHARFDPTWIVLAFSFSTGMIVFTRFRPRPHGDDEIEGRLRALAGSDTSIPLNACEVLLQHRMPSRGETAGERGGEFTTWASNQDRHSRAYLTLTTLQSQDIERIYRGIENARAEEDNLCLRCHDTLRAQSPPWCRAVGAWNAGVATADRGNGWKPTRSPGGPPWASSRRPGRGGSTCQLRLGRPSPASAAMSATGLAR